MNSHARVTLDDAVVTRLPVGHAAGRFWVVFVVETPGMLGVDWTIGAHVKVSSGGHPVDVLSKSTSGMEGGGYSMYEIADSVTFLEFDYLDDGRVASSEKVTVVDV